MPSLDWTGKEAVVRASAAATPGRTLEEVSGLSHGAAGSGNLVVQGDNLPVLDALLARFAGKVRCAYIDPPYNTGRSGPLYDDSADSPEIRHWLAETLGDQAGRLDRHDRWLCMMYPRLARLRRMLRRDGVVFASIDDAGLSALDLLMGEVFGRTNRIGILTWQRKKKGSHLDRHLRRVSEFVVCYARDRTALPRLFGEAACAGKHQPLVKRTGRPGVLDFPPGVVVTTLEDGDYPRGFRGSEGTGLDFVASFRVRRGVVASTLCVAGRFVWTRTKLEAELALGSTVTLSRRFGLSILRHDQARRTKAPCSLLLPHADIGTNEDATRELADVFGREPGVVFPNPKPVSLIRYLLRAATRDDPAALVLDAFAGSGTTAAAVLALNAEDRGRRRFILVEMDERIAREVTAERVRRACVDHAMAGGREAATAGFRYCRLRDARDRGLSAP